MTADKRRADAPADVKVIMTASLFTEAQNARIRELDRKVVELGEQLVACLAEAGQALAEFFSGHVVEGTANRAVLEPLERDAGNLVTILNQIDTRLQVAMPPTSIEQFLGAVTIQLKDVDETTRRSRATQPSTVAKDLENLVSRSYVALTAGYMAMEEAAQTMDHGRESNGALSADDSSLFAVLKREAKESADTADAIKAWRRRQAESEVRS